MELLEKYRYDEDGYNPYLIREGWQVAKLNYVEGHGLDQIDNLEVHQQTDEVFILLEGCGVLILAQACDEGYSFEVVVMQKGVTYNVPRGVWHNIAMDRAAQIIIVEKDNTHLHDVSYATLCGVDTQTVKELVIQAVN